MDYFGEYQLRRGNICDLLARASEFFKGFAEDKAANLEELQKAVATGKFSIIVAGQFSSGKSTLLNAMMGQKYLPSFTKETTATINELKPIAESPIEGKEAMRVNYKDGKSVVVEDVSLESISKYVCTDGDDVVNKIASVELFLDSPFLNDGVRLIDTPGLNGIAEGHADITRREFGQAHAAIFMFSAAQPGAATDYDILKEMKSYGNSIIFVMNRIDAIQGSEKETPESVIEGLRRGFAQKFPGETLPEIWPVSAYRALVARNNEPLKYNDRYYESEEDIASLLETSRIEPFEDRLIRYLTKGERAKDELLSPIKQLEAHIEKSRAEINAELSVYESDVTVEELQKQKDTLESEIAEVKRENQKNSFDVKRRVREIIENATDAITSGGRELRARYEEKVEKSQDDLEDFEANSRSYLRRMELEYCSLIDSNLSSLGQNVRNIIQDKFEEYSAIVGNHLSQVRNAAHIELEKTKWDDSIFEVEMDFDQYQSQLEDLFDRQLQASMDVEDMEVRIHEAQRNEERAERAKNDLDQTRREHREEELSLGDRPTEEHRQRTVTKERGGILGFYQWVFTGNRDRYVTETYLDKQAQEAYDARLNRIRELQFDELNEKQARYDELNAMDMNVARHEADARKARVELAYLEKQIERLKNERERTLEKGLKKRKRAAKAYVGDSLDAIHEQAQKRALNALNEQQEIIASAVTNIISEVMAMACEDKQHQLDAVISTINAGAEEKERVKDILKERDAKLQELLYESVDLRREIEDLETDTIQQG